MTERRLTRRAAGALEGEVLAALWTLGVPATVGQVQATLRHPPAYTTVFTILNRLGDKGMVRRQPAESGHGYTYTPLISESTVAARQFGQLLDRGADRRAVLRGLVDAISAEDAELLRALLERAESGPPAGEVEG
jgi:predicted transcriptional regulator